MAIPVNDSQKNYDISKNPEKRSLACAADFSGALEHMFAGQIVALEVDGNGVDALADAGYYKTRTSALKFLEANYPFGESKLSSDLTIIKDSFNILKDGTVPIDLAIKAIILGKKNEKETSNDLMAVEVGNNLTVGDICNAIFGVRMNRSKIDNGNDKTFKRAVAKYYGITVEELTPNHFVANQTLGKGISPLAVIGFLIAGGAVAFYTASQFLKNGGDASVIGFDDTQSTHTASPTETPFPPTDVPPTPTLDAEFNMIVERLYNAGISQDIINSSENAKLSDDGSLEIKNSDGNVFRINKSDLAKRLEVGPLKTLQILNEDHTEVQYAYDVDKKEFIFREDYVNPDFTNEEAYPSVDVDDLSDFVRRTKLFVKSFPPNVILPTPGSISIENYSYSGGASFPFGSPSDGDAYCARNFTFFKIRLDPVENPDLYTACSLSLVPNIDGTFALLPVTVPGGGDMYVEPDGYVHYIATLGNHTGGGRVLLPVDIIRDFDHPVSARKIKSYLKYLKEKEISYNTFATPRFGGRTVRMPFFTDLIVKWLETGIVPHDLENHLSNSAGLG